MIRSILLAFIATLVLAGSAAAQFPGYPPAGNIQIGQGSTAPPAWNPLNGDCTSNSIGAIVCTKTNGVTFYTGLPSPVNPNDAATKQYVDNSASGLSLHTAAALATTTALPANTYNNGTSGVGATLTSTCSSSCPAPTIDSVAVTLGQRVLIKNEAAPANNGIYVVSTVGTGSTPYVLTRATDANTPGTADVTKIGFGTYLFVNGGTVNGNSGWSVNSAVVTIGASAINWAQFIAGGGVTSFGGLVGVIGCGTGVTCANGVVSLQSTAPQGRLTLASNTPVMNTTQAAKTTLFYDCFHGGNLVPYFTGTFDTTDTIASCEVSTALQASSTGVLNTASVFDIWWEGNSHHNICVATNGSGGGWGSDTGGSNTTRGTGYSQLDLRTRPYITNANSVTHCYNGATDYGAISANKLTYLGTVYTSAAGQLTWQFGASGAPPTPGLFGVWNMYNRVGVGTTFGDSRASWTYGSTTIREADALNNSGAFRVTVVSGLTEGTNSVTYQDLVVAGSSGFAFAGVCFDATNSFAGGAAGVGTNVSGNIGQPIGQYANSAIGLHFYSACEKINTAVSQTFQGANNGIQVSNMVFQGNF